MIGIALEGGAERSSFTAGVIDALMAVISTPLLRPARLPVPAVC